LGALEKESAHIMRLSLFDLFMALILLSIALRNPLTAVIGNYANFLGGGLTALAFIVFSYQAALKKLISRGVFRLKTDMSIEIVVLLSFVVYLSLVLLIYIPFIKQALFLLLGFISFANFILLFFMIYFFAHKNNIDVLIKILIFVTALLSFFGILQTFLDLPFGQIPAQRFSFISIYPMRISSTTGSTLHLAIFIALLFPLITNLAVQQKSTRLRIGLAILMAAMLFVLLGTQSRGAIIQLFISIGTLFIVSKEFRVYVKRRWHVLVIFLVLMIIVFPTGIKTDIVKRISSTIDFQSDVGNVLRVEHWNEAIKNWGSNENFAAFLFGRGLGSTGNIVKYFGYDPFITESYVLKILFEIGLVGLLFFSLFYAAFLAIGFNLSLNRRAPSPYRIIVQGICAALVGLACELFALQALDGPPVAAVFYIYLGILSWVKRRERIPRLAERTSVPKPTN
jgi:O-antigen ligase